MPRKKSSNLTSLSRPVQRSTGPTLIGTITYIIGKYLINLIEKY